MRHVLIWMIRMYQKHWSHRTGTCWQNPSCSEYGIQAVQKYGVIDGIILIGERIEGCTDEERRKFHEAYPELSDSARRYNPCL